MSPYHYPQGGLPPQTALMTQRAVFTESYAFIPRGCFSDIVTSYLPGWDKTRLWLIARPMTGFSETFSQYVMEVAPGGGSDAPDPETGAEHWLFFTAGPVEQAITAKNFGFEPDADQQRMAGFGSLPAALDALEGAVAGKAIQQRRNDAAENEERGQPEAARQFGGTTRRDGGG